MNKTFSLFTLAMVALSFAACQSSEAVTRNAISFNDYNYNVVAAEQGFFDYSILENLYTSLGTTIDYCPELDYSELYKYTDESNTDSTFLGGFRMLVLSSPNITSVEDSTLYDYLAENCDTLLPRFIKKKYIYPQEGEYLQLFLMLYSSGKNKICEGVYSDGELASFTKPDTKITYPSTIPFTTMDLSPYFCTTSIINSRFMFLSYAVIGTKEGPTMAVFKPFVTNTVTIKQGTMAYDIEIDGTLAIPGKQNNVPLKGRYTGFVPKIDRILCPDTEGLIVPDMTYE